MHYINGEGTGKNKDCASSSDASLLWKSNKAPPNLTRYNLTSFAITLNELTPGLKVEMMHRSSFPNAYSFFFYACLIGFIDLSDFWYLITD